MKKRLILAINPGSTSTKIALFEEENLIFEKNIEHNVSELSNFKRITEQFQFRKNLIITELESCQIQFSEIKAVVGRGGLVKPIESGVYAINKKMLEDLQSGVMGEHASNLGGLIANDIASELSGVQAFIVDPVVVDEMCEVAKISGHPEIKRRSIFHALNHKAVARHYAASIGKQYENLNLIIAHLGGGVSVGAHCNGKVIDVNNALNGDGPFSPERSGGLPAGQLVELCFSGKYSHNEIKSMLTGKGGMVAYLGTNSFKEVCKMAADGNSEAKLILDAFVYQVAKEIGAMAAVLKGKVDAVILTGGMAYDSAMTNSIKQMVNFIADVVVYAGEDEMKALAFNVLQALDNKIRVKTYS